MSAGSVTRLSSRKPKTVTLSAQAIAEAGLTARVDGLQLAAFLGELAAANQSRPALAQRLQREARVAGEVHRLGTWLCTVSHDPESRAA
jgi:hypothetical protein